MEAATVTVLIVLALTPGFLFWAGFYSPIYGYLEYDVSSWRTPGQLARTLVTAHVVHLALLFSLSGFGFFAPAAKDLEGACRVFACDELYILSALTAVSAKVPDTLFAAITGPLNSGIDERFVIVNLYLIGAAAIAYHLGNRFGKWGINPLLEGTRREKLAKKFIAHRFVYELIQDVQYRAVVKTAYLLARFEDGGQRCIYRGIVEDFSFSKTGTLIYVVLSTLAKAKRNAGGSSVESSLDGEAVDWAPIGHRESGRAYFSGDEIENAVFENAPNMDPESGFSSPGEVDRFAMYLRKAVEILSERVPANRADSEGKSG